MRRPRRNHALVVALYVNAALLLAVLVALVSGSRMPSVLPEAYAAPLAAQPIAGGGAGLYLMPAQFTDRNFGCYVMDVEAQTLIAYQWEAGSKKLRLVAARDFSNDRKLHDFNTDNPTPAEVAKLLELERSGRRDNRGAAAQPGEDQPDAKDAPAPAE
jgi:hypothetical protein